MTLKPLNLTCDPLHMRITFLPIVAEDFSPWASLCGCRPGVLRQRTLQAIRMRHSQATFEHRSHRRHRRQPAIYSLSLNPGSNVSVYYTIERRQVIVRGYGVDLGREPLDDFDAGGFHPDLAWYQLPKDWLYEHPEFAWLKPQAQG